ncbi:hypothetical protein [Actinomadura sp. SCN-SB]|uniref:hypothetical protein n=1 Tax=Actinomadura sp. SCN-SB TaxID=3373092 RepID=UPI0037509EE6
MQSKINTRHNQLFQEDDQVLVWYPPRGADEHDDTTWSWLPGTILAQGAPDEWYVLVEVPSLAEPDPTIPNGEAPENLLYPTCFRDASELRAVTVREWGRLHEEWAGD